MSPTAVLLLFLSGLVAGFVNVMAGGGSLLTMPIMVFMELPGPVVNGTNRVAVLVQNFTAVIAFFRHGLSDFRLSISLTACALPGTLVGAALGTLLEGVWFNRVLAGVMIAVMLLMLRGKRVAARPADRPASSGRMAVAHLLMVGVGFYSGIIQAGVGFLVIAVLHQVLGMDLVRVNMHKVFIIGVSTLLALMVFASQGQVDWLLGAVLAVGNAAGAWAGAHYAVKKGERLIRIILNAALIVMAVKLLWPG
jgi:uncharacterized protein